MKDYRELHARACSCVWHLDSCRQLSLCCLRVVAVLYRCSYVLRFLVASRHSACHVFSCWNSSGSRASSTASASKKSTSKGGSEVQFSSSWRLRLFACSLPRSFSFSIFFARVCCVFTHPRNAGVFFYLIGFVFALPCSVFYFVLASLFTCLRGAVAVVLAFRIFPRDVQLYHSILPYHEALPLLLVVSLAKWWHAEVGHWTRHDNIETHRNSKYLETLKHI